MERDWTYVEPRHVADQPAVFYHSMTLANGERIEGNWDLDFDTYLGGVGFEGKLALDVGTASGALTWEMERRGAQVISYDLALDSEWDVIPFPHRDYREQIAQRKGTVAGLHDSWWYCHERNRSSARAVYGNVYEIPADLGPVDVTVFGALLVHLRDPFLALQRGTRVTRETLIVTQRMPKVRPRLLDRPFMEFMPNAQKPRRQATWWHLTPVCVERMMGLLGFEDTTVTTHQQRHYSGMKDLYTVVGRRTEPFDPERGF